MEPQPIEALIEDPIIKLLILAVVVVGVVDAFKFAMSWIWKKVSDKKDD